MNSSSNQLSQPQVSFYPNFYSKGEQTYLPEIFDKIKQGGYRDKIDKIRLYTKTGEREKKDQLKKELPCFTPSGTFNEKRNSDNLEQYSGIVHFDYDKIPPDFIDEAIKIVVQDPYTYACFLSPSGNGFKVFAIVNTGAEIHKEVHQKAKDHFDRVVGVVSDVAGKDLPRLCFVSYDPDLFYNPDCQIFAYQPSSSGTKITGISKGQGANNETFESCVEFTERLIQYYPSNRNTFIYHLACNCNRIGIPEEETLQKSIARYDLSTEELERTVHSAYINNVNEFAKHAKYANRAELEDGFNFEEPEAGIVGATSCLPDEIFPKLPGILKDGCNVLPEVRERDVMLTTAITIISGCLPNVVGSYAEQLVYPNLFCFVVAPAASGKGVMNFAKALTDRVHDELLSESREADRIYQATLEEHRHKRRFKKKNDAIDGPLVQPRMKMLLIPANVSYARFIWHLEQNDGAGILIETEADTMVHAFKQEWGAYSDLLRKGFHHERISSSKKTGNEYIEISSPRLSVALSGTPSQVLGLIASSEDGLFSRFIFYTYRLVPSWKDVSPNMKGSNLNQYFKSLSDKVYAQYKFLEEYETVVDLTADQWTRLNTTCTEWLNKVTVFNGDEASSVVKRIGLIMYRFAMILTAMRKFETKDKRTKAICSDEDFDIAMKLASVYLEHSIFMFNNLPRQQKIRMFHNAGNKQKFFDELPERFKRSEAIELGAKHGMRERTVDGLLKRLLETKYLQQEAFGVYVKCNNLNFNIL